MASDPYKYFRVEARELLEGLTRGVLELEKGSGGRELVARLLRLAHTLKGAARVVRQPTLAEHAHAVEDELTAHSGGPLSRERSDAVLKLLDAIASGVAALGAQAEARPGDPSPPPAEEPFDTVRVDVREMDALLEGVFEAAVQLGGLRQEMDGVHHARAQASALVDRMTRHRDAGTAPRSAGGDGVRLLAEDLLASIERLERGLATGLDQEERELTQVRDAATRLRLLPASAVFGPLERAVRDAAQSSQKSAAFEATGGERRVDASVLAALRDALLHVVRNAVAHGIEPEQERASAGKPALGRVELRVERRGHRLAFVCRDDGRGVDVEAVRRAAVGRGLLSRVEADALPPDEVVRLVLKGGLTTRDAATQMAGRGVGLDVVRETVARLKGEVGIRSEAGRGTTVEICVPVSLSSLPALLVEAGGVTAAVPMDAVRRTLRVPGADVARSAEGASVEHEGRVLPFLPLAAVLRRDLRPGRPPQTWSVLVIGSGATSAAFGVERILGIANVVVRSLPRAEDADPVVAGAALDAFGNPQLVLDPGSLVAVAHSGRPTSPETAAESRPPVLVIDDSLTTRMLEQSILESAGYAVDLAVSGEEALRRARERRYALFVVDVEMPGMDGFEFLARAGADPALRDVPGILVTSRSSPDDRRQGELAGARAYIVKSEFDQSSLLRTIHDLVGKGEP